MTSNTIISNLCALDWHRQLYVAYSGGVDSHVLLDFLCWVVDKPEKITAIHINHHLQPEADQWQAHCQQVCEAYQVGFIAKSVNLDLKRGESLEATARDARYQALYEGIGEDDYLLTGHHQHDQVETFLLQLLRGAGLAGLSAMPIQSGQLVRPLLACDKAFIVDYARVKGLKWIEDSSNQDPRFARNYLRHEVLPMITARWPSAHKTISRSIDHIQKGLAINDAVAAEDLSFWTEKSFPIGLIANLPRLRQLNALHFWIRYKKFPVPSTRVFNRIIDELIMTGEDKCPLVTWQGGELRRYQLRLHIMKPMALTKTVDEHCWQGEHLLPLNDGYLRVEKTSCRGVAAHWLEAPHRVCVRYRQGGEKIALRIKGKRQRLKKHWQAWEVPPWLRDYVPLIYIDDELAAVANYAVAEKFLGNEEDIRKDFHWQPSTLQEPI